MLDPMLDRMMLPCAPISLFCTHPAKPRVVCAKRPVNENKHVREMQGEEEETESCVVGGPCEQMSKTRLRKTVLQRLLFDIVCPALQMEPMLAMVVASLVMKLITAFFLKPASNRSMVGSPAS